jgi:hypothetical protein
MRRHWIRTVAVLLIAVFCQIAAAQKAARLVVDNRTKQAATIQVWRYTGYHWDWLTVATVPAGRWVPVTDIKNGERFRVKDTAKARVVNLRNDPGYGGPQDVWVLQ